MVKESENTRKLALDPSETDDFRLLDTILVNDPQIIPLLLNDQKWLILEKLIQTPKTIRQLSDELHINPGTIKRHIEDLLVKRLIVPSKAEMNEHGITLKFYRAVAKKYIIHLEMPKSGTNNPENSKTI